MRSMTKFVMLLCLLVVGRGAFAQSTGAVTYVYTDPQGTPLAEADASGNITATFDYTPYGTTALGNAPNGPGYTGHVNDPETNLVYMQARYYDPATGRFLSVDPVTPTPASTLNFSRYAYANNNPIAYTDATGAAPGDFDSGCGAFHCQTTFFGNNGQNDGGSDSTSSTSNASRPAGWQWLLLKATDVLCQVGAPGACDEGPLNSQPIKPESNSEENWSFAGSILGQGVLLPIGGGEAGLGIESRVISETLSGSGNFASKYTLTADQALNTGLRWLGPGYQEIGASGSGVYRSADGIRQFRMDNNSLSGSHSPGVPHVHLEIYAPNGRRPIVNNHVPFVEK